MDYIKSWAVSLIGLLLITAILKYLMPSGSVKKSADTVISIMVLIMLISPLGILKNTELSLPEISFNFNEQKGDEQVYSSAVKKAGAQALDSKQIIYKSVNAVTETDSEGYVVINRVEVELENTEDAQTALKAIEEETGIEREAVRIYG